MSTATSSEVSLPTDPVKFFADFDGDHLGAFAKLRELMPLLVAARADVQERFRFAIPADVMRKPAFDKSLREAKADAAAARTAARSGDGPATKGDLPYPDRVRARLRFDDELFVQYTDGLYRIMGRGKGDEDDGKLTRSLLIRGQLVIEAAYQPRTVENDRTPGEAAADESYAVRIEEVPGEPQPLRSVVSSRDLRKARDADWPDTTKLARHVSPRKLPLVPLVIRAAVQRARLTGTSIEDRFDSTGPLRREGLLLAFLDPSGPAITAEGTDPSALCELGAQIGRQRGVQMLGVDTPNPDTLVEDFAELLTIAEVEPGNPAIPLTLLSQLTTAPLVGVVDRAMTCSLIYGPLNQLKSAICRLILQAQSRSAFGRELPVTVNLRPGGSTTTTFAAEKVTHALAGFLPVLDDIIVSGLGQKQLADRIGFLSSYGSHAVEGAAALKGHWGKEVTIRGEGPRASSVFTAEGAGDQEKQASTHSRFIVLKHPGSEAVDMDVLNRLQTLESARKCSRAWGYIVRWLYADATRADSAYERAGEIVQSWDLGGAVFLRSAEMYTRNVAGLVLLTTAAEAAGVDMTGWLEAHTPHLRTALVEQGERMGAREGASSHLSVPETVREAIRDALARRSMFLHGEQDKPQQRHPLPDLPEDFGPSDAGWEPSPSPMTAEQWVSSPRSVPIGPVIGPPTAAGRRPRFEWTLRVRASSDWPQLYRIVRKYADEKGVPLESARDTLRELEAAGHVVTGQQPNGATIRHHLFDLAWLLGCDAAALAEDLARDESAAYAEAAERAEVAAPVLPPAASPSTASDTAAPEPPATSQPRPPSDEPTAYAPHRCDVCGKPCWLVDDQGPFHPACRGRVVDGSSMPADPVRPAAAAATPLSDASTSVTEQAPTPAPAEPSTVPQPTAAAEESEAEPVDDARGFAVLGAKGIHRHPDAPADPLPFDVHNVGDLYRLAEQFDLTRVVVHPSAHELLALPARPRTLAPREPMPHAWAEADGYTVRPDGLTPWFRVQPTDRTKPGVTVAIPGYDSRRTTVWGEAATGGDLFEALSLFQTVTGLDWHHSTNATAGDLFRRETHVTTWEQYLRAGKKGRKPKVAMLRPVEAMPPPALDPGREQDLRWIRSLTDTEREAGFVHAYDGSGAYPNAVSGLELGTGSPVHRPDGPEFDPRLPGYWRVRVDPAATFDDLAPALFAGYPVEDDGSLWVSTPTLAFARDCGVPFVVEEAYVWTAHRRWLAAWGKSIGGFREELSAIPSPSAALAHQAVKRLYTSGIGALSSSGWDRSRDELFRPDFRHLVMANARMRVLRRIQSVAVSSGQLPVAVSVDCLYYVGAEIDPESARPMGLPPGTGFGQYKVEGSARMAEAVGLIDAGDLTGLSRLCKLGVS